VNTSSALRSQMHRLTVVRDGDEYVVGRADLGIYVAVTEPGAVFIVALRDGQTLANATELASSAAGVRVEVDDFLTGLREAGLLAGAGEQVPRVPQRLIRPLFGRIAWGFYGLTAVAVVVGLLLRPDLRPVFGDVWFLDSPFWSVLAIAGIAVVITAGRECWHWLAVRAMGVPARLRMGHRGIFIVFVTDMSRLATVPRRARYSPMLAGFAFDVAVMALAMGVRFGYREGVLPYSAELDALLGAVAFRQLVVIFWQLAGIAFRTDGYQLLANALGCHNLYRATSLTAKHWVWRLNEREAKELAGMGARDRAVATWFWLVHLAGLLIMLGVLVTYLVPPAFGTLVLLTTGTSVFWQSVAVVVMLLAQFAAFPLIDMREKRRRHTRQEPAPSPRTLESV
jgi:putative peptide zinc metalloprotease protein